MPHDTPVPFEMVRKWQEIVDLLAEIVHVPSALIMRVEPPNIKVFVSSESEGNPYEPAELAPLAQQANNPLAIVVVGTAFGGEIVNPQAHVAQVAPRRPPNVRKDPGATLGPLQQVRAKVPFRIMVPQVVERSSNLAQLEPVRVFKPTGAGGAHELALTYVTGASNVYWDVIETNWKSAPILRHETGTYSVTGRKLHLFTTGGNIHMIVFYKGPASYWVVNTLRDELSNETMLAIAKGLQPLGK